MSGAMQRETEKAEELYLEQSPKTTTIGDRLVVFSFPGAMSDESREKVEHELCLRLRPLGLTGLVLDCNAEAYQPSAIGTLALQLAEMEGKIEALSEMVGRLLEFVEAGEDDEPEGRTLDGDPAGRARDLGASL